MRAQRSLKQYGSLLPASVTERVIPGMGVAGLYLFALSGFVSTTGIELGLLLMLLAALPRLPAIWHRLRHDPLLWAVAAFVVYVLVRSLWASREFPSTAEMQAEIAWDLVRVGGPFAFLAAWWLGADTARVNRILLLSLVGLGLGVAYHAGPELLEILAHPARVGAGISANGLGLYSATALLGLVVLGGVAWWSRARAGWTRLAIAVALVVAVASVLELLLLSQSRSSWAALAVVLPVVGVLAVIRARRGNARAYPAVWGATGLLVVVIAGVAYTNLTVVEARLTEEHKTVQQLAALDFDVAQRRAISKRILMWRQGLDRAAERPMFGWGPGSAAMLLNQSRFEKLRDLPHFHNIYLDLWVRLGLVGLALAALVVVLFARRAWQSYRTGAMPEPLTWFLAGSLALYAVASAFQIRYDDHNGMFYTILLAGLAYTYALRDRRQETAEASSPASSPRALQ